MGAGFTCPDPMGREESLMKHHLLREWHFLRTQHYAMALLLCSFLLSAFAVFTGLNEVSSQRQTIEHLKQADVEDRSKMQAKYDDPGYLAYYSFHLTYSEPSNLAFAALGERDLYPWKHRIRMLALEGQIYESDTQNAELAQVGKIDFAFLVSALVPLFIILLFHDVIANERGSGRHDLLVTTAKSINALWGAKVGVRFVALYLCVFVPFLVGALLSATEVSDWLLVALICAAYMAFWTALSLYVGRHSSHAPTIASGLIAVWIAVAFIIPIVGDKLIKQQIPSPKGSDILLTQRESVNDAWDLPVADTMQAFIKTHPEYSDYKSDVVGFDWKWYYAFQQLGDQAAADLSKQYRDASSAMYQRAGYLAWIAPPILFQRYMTRLANTDALAAFAYEQDIRDFHQQLRHFYYPWLFIHTDFDKAQLEQLPKFGSLKVRPHSSTP
jgi:ABC-2 type transport system permease protein